jgi:ABC-type sugar transport system ATPase subunit
MRADGDLMSILAMKGIYKAFPGIVAVDHVDLTLEKGEALALVGENGAGKSTLIKILSGAYQMDGGVVEIEGAARPPYNTREAIELGIGIVYQELNYLGAMSIAENLFIGRVPTAGPMCKVDYPRLYREARAVMKQFGLEHREPETPVEALSVAEKQLVEIARAFTRDVKILVLDEPTSALNDQETENLFRLIRDMKARGVSIIYISHRLNEIFEIADTVQVMRDGRNVAKARVSDTSTDQIVSWMVGREIRDMYPSRSVPEGREVFAVEGLTTDFLKDVAFGVRSGEVVGLFGLMGAGRGEIAECIVGLKPCRNAKMTVGGKAYRPRLPIDAIRSGIAYVPAERKSDGINLIAPVRDNITVANLKKVAPRGFLSLKRETDLAKGWIARLGIKTPGVMTEADNLSGGNQQKVVIAKGLNTEPTFMILNEPTRGVDVGAKVEIYNLINDLCRNGKAVLMISSELPEIMSMSDRIYIVHEGRITGQLDRKDFSQETLLKYAIGG